MCLAAILYTIRELDTYPLSLKQVHWNHSKLSINSKSVLTEHRVALSCKAIPKLTITIICFPRGGSCKNYTSELYISWKFQSHCFILQISKYNQRERRQAFIYDSQKGNVSHIVLCDIHFWRAIISIVLIFLHSHS